MRFIAEKILFLQKLLTRVKSSSRPIATRLNGIRIYWLDIATFISYPLSPSLFLSRRLSNAELFNFQLAMSETCELVLSKARLLTCFSEGSMAFNNHELVYSLLDPNGKRVNMNFYFISCFVSCLISFYIKIILMSGTTFFFLQQLFNCNEQRFDQPGNLLRKETSVLNNKIDIFLRLYLIFYFSLFSFICY